MRKLSLAILSLVLGFVLCLSSCKKGVENPHSYDPPQLHGLPVIHYFTATPEQILWGESFVLSWHVSNASYWIIKDHKGVTWFESTRIDNPWGECASTLRPDYLADWSYDVITTFTLTATNSNGQVQASCTVETPPNLAEVVMIWGPSGGRPGNQYIYEVRGGVKNIGSLPAFNTKVSVELWGCYGNLLASGECIVAEEDLNGRLEPQQEAGWCITFDDTYSILYQQMDWTSEIKYEITWDEVP
jgi:hypothetical protein